MNAAQTDRHLIVTHALLAAVFLAGFVAVPRAAIAADAKKTPSAAEKGPPQAAKKGPPEAAKKAPAKKSRPADARPDLVPANVRNGRIIRVPLPVTGRVVEQVRRQTRAALENARSAGQRLVLVYQFEIAADQAEYAKTTEYGSAYNLADFLSSEELNGVQTVAYAPTSLEGHAILVAMACDVIALGPEGSIGPAIDRATPPTAPVLAAYKEIGDRRQTIPPTIALGMLGANEDILQVHTDTDDVFVRASELDELKKRRTIRSTKVVIRKGEAGKFSAAEAYALGLAKFLPSDRRQLATWLDLPPEDLQDDPSLADRWRPVRVNVKGVITSALVDQVQRIIEEEISNEGVNFVCLWIDSPGGSLTNSMRLATYLAGLDPGRVRTVAYVPNQARADAALVAIGCDQLLARPTAVLGGAGASSPTDEEARQARRVIHEELAVKKGRSWSLPAALIDPQLTVFHYVRDAENGYFSQEEWAELPGRAKWQQREMVTQAGTPLELSGQDAAKLGLATRTVASFLELRQHFGLEDEPSMREPGWADFLIDALASPGVAILLLVVGFVALYIELHTPGLGIGGFIATLCFVLFFWSRYLGGTAGWLEVMLFLSGLAFLALEVFVLPGFGIFGLGGGALLLASVILASQTSTSIIPHNSYQLAQLRNSLWIVLVAILGAFAVAAFVRRWLPKAPIFNQILLSPPLGEEAQTIRHREALVNLVDLIGQHGVTTTHLVPGGKARFGNRLLDVIAEGEDIVPGTEIVVVEVHGNRIVVQPLSPGRRA